jgi:hypothetical protein
MYYCQSKREARNRLKVLALGLIIGLSVGLCAGFLWGTAEVESLIKASLPAVTYKLSNAIAF